MPNSIRPMTTALVALGWSTAAWAALPIGYVDKTTDNEVVGWARDPDSTGAIAVHIYVDDVIQAGVDANLDFEYIRPDAFAGGHGFYWRHDDLGPGTHHIDAYAIDVAADGALTGQNPPLVFNDAQTFGPFLFGYYWGSAPGYPNGLDDRSAEFIPFTNVLFAYFGDHPSSYFERINLSGSKLILDLTYCMFYDLGDGAGARLFEDYETFWAGCKATWISKFRQQNIHGFYLFDEPGIGDQKWRDWMSILIALVHRDFPGKRAIISGHAGSWSPDIPSGLDVFTISLACYWSDVQGCKDNYAMLPASFSRGQLLTVGAYNDIHDSAGEQDAFLNWGASDSRFDGVIAFLYNEVTGRETLRGVGSTPQVLASHQAFGHRILCANTTEDDPVCGANGVSYKNPDQSKCAGTTIVRYGNCCNNECARGQRRCVGNEVQECVPAGDCWVWPSVHSAGCPTVLGPWSAPACDGDNRVIHTRTYEPGTCQDGQCAGSQTETEQIENCAQGSICQDGACVATVATCATDPSLCDGGTDTGAPDATTGSDTGAAAPDAGSLDAAAGTDAIGADTSAAGDAHATSSQPATILDSGAAAQPTQLGDGMSCSSSGHPAAVWALLGLLALTTVRCRRRARAWTTAIALLALIAVGCTPQIQPSDQVDDTGHLQDAGEAADAHIADAHTTDAHSAAPDSHPDDGASIVVPDAAVQADRAGDAAQAQVDSAVVGVDAGAPDSGACDPNHWVVLGSQDVTRFVTGAVFAGIVYGGTHLGGHSAIYTYDPGTLALAQQQFFGGESVLDFEEFGGALYSTHENTAQVYRLVGSQWQLVHAHAGWDYMFFMTVFQGALYLTGGTAEYVGLLRTVDGQQFDLVAEFPGTWAWIPVVFADALYLLGHAGAAYAGDPAVAYRSTDGMHFEQVAALAGGPEYQTAFAWRGHLYLGTGGWTHARSSDDSARLYRFDGATRVEVLSVAKNGVTSIAADGDKIYAAIDSGWERQEGTSFLYQSSDGVDWQFQRGFDDPELRHIAVHQQGLAVFGGRAGGHGVIYGSGCFAGTENSSAATPPSSTTPPSPPQLPGCTAGFGCVCDGDYCGCILEVSDCSQCPAYTRECRTSAADPDQRLFCLAESFECSPGGEPPGPQPTGGCDDGFQCVCDAAECGCILEVADCSQCPAYTRECRTSAADPDQRLFCIAVNFVCSP